VNKLEKLRKLEADGACYTVALLGAGYVSGGVIDIIEETPGFRVALVVNRTTQKATDLLESKAISKSDIVCSGGGFRLPGCLATQSGHHDRSHRCD